MKANEVISSFYLQGALCMGPRFSLCSRYCWMIFGRTSAHLFTRMKVGHGWTPIRKIVTFSWNWQPKNSGKLMKCKWKGASRCISAILIQEAVPNHFLVDIGNPPKLRNWDWYVSLRTAMNTGRVWQAPFSLSPRTVEDISSISCRTWDFGFYAHATCRISGRQAEELQRKALAGRETQLGADHPETLESISHLAVVLQQQGKLDEAGPRSLGWREVVFLEPEGKAWMLPCFPLFLDSNLRVFFAHETMWQVIHLCIHLSFVEVIFVYIILICFCFPHLLTMCPPSAKTHEV